MRRHIRILTTIASAEWCFNPGVVVRCGTKFETDVEVPLDVAEKWVAGGVRAEWVAGPQEVEEVEQEQEATSSPEPETAVARRGKRART